MALFNAATYAREEEEPARQGELLDELRSAHAAHGDDDTVKWCLGQSLLNAAADAEERGDLPVRDALMAELKGMTEEEE
jgi:hypothetical protein